MSSAIATTSSGAILYDPERLGRDGPNDAWFDAAFWESKQKIVARSSAGRGAVLFVRDDKHYWAVRHYRRGGLIGKLIADSYVWLGAERTRAFAEWRLLHTLRARGLPVPVPVAARFVRHGFTYRADLITEALPAVRPLSDAITGARLPEETWRKIGATIAKFHRAGAHHADLNAHNILLGESATVWVLDFDRGRIRARGAWEDAVLARLQRSLNKIKSQRANVGFGTREWQVLMESYRTGRDA